MSEVEAFITAPSQESLDKCTKEQLLQIAEHYSVEVVGDKRIKETIKSAIKSKLLVAGIVSKADFSQSPTTHGLTFEQQKEMLMLQLDHEKMKHELDIKKQLEVEKMRQSIEKAKIDLEGDRLLMVREGLLSSEAHDRQQARSSDRFDLSNLRLLPQFNEKDPDTFFLLFDRVAKARNWPEGDCALMLQCVLSGKAQEAYASLSPEDSSSYDKIKSAVLRAYELVPEAYRQRFRSWEKENGQTYAEFARDLSTHFRRWLTALEVTTFEDLCNLVILEQFKNNLPERVSTYISERKVVTAGEAAVAADQYILLHKSSFRERHVASDFGAQRSGFDAPSDMMRSKKNSESLCNLDKLLAHLPESKRSELAELIHKFPCLFGDIPSRTSWIKHDIDVGDAQPIKFGC